MLPHIRRDFISSSGWFAEADALSVLEFNLLVRYSADGENVRVRSIVTKSARPREKRTDEERIQQKQQKKESSVRVRPVHTLMPLCLTDDERARAATIFFFLSFLSLSLASRSPLAGRIDCLFLDAFVHLNRLAFRHERRVNKKRRKCQAFDFMHDDCGRYLENTSLLLRRS